MHAEVYIYTYMLRSVMLTSVFDGIGLETEFWELPRKFQKERLANSLIFPDEFTAFFFFSLFLQLSAVLFLYLFFFTRKMIHRLPVPDLNNSNFITF